MVLQRHMSPTTVRGVSVSVALSAGVSLVAILEKGEQARVSTTARYHFSTYINIIGTRIMFN